MAYTPRVVNGTDNFRSESASATVFKDMVCNFWNPTDTDANTDIHHADIQRIWYCYYPTDKDYPQFFAVIRPNQLG
jgi:hypothetical protein